jgi:nucleotide-binding universal stress UspA family protein
MNARKILFPTDFSELSHAGLEYATSLALDTGGKLLIVHVEEPAAAYGGGGDVFYVVPEPDDAMSIERLEAVVPADASVPCEHRLLTGDPATEIVRVAREENVDLIVMGTHGRTGLMRLLMGSVAEAVVRRSPCPVFTLKQPHETLVETH